MLIKDRKSKFGLAFWIIFVLLLGFAVFILTTKGGTALSRISASIKETLFPFG